MAMAPGEAVGARTASNSAYRGVVPRFAKAVLQAGDGSAEALGGEQIAHPINPAQAGPRLKPLRRRGRNSNKPKVAINGPVGHFLLLLGGPALLA